jgi:hypothetical protein
MSCPRSRLSDPTCRHRGHLRLHPLTPERALPGVSCSRSWVACLAQQWQMGADHRLRLIEAGTGGEAGEGIHIHSQSGTTVERLLPLGRLAEQDPWARLVPLGAIETTQG